MDGTDDTPAMAHEILRAAVRQLIADSGLKQTWIADKLGITEKHLSSVLTGRTGLGIDLVHRIVSVCHVPLNLVLEPQEWVEDVVTWRERAETAEKIIADLEFLHVKSPRLVKSWDYTCERHSYGPTGNYKMVVLEDLRTCPDCRFSEYAVCSHCACPHERWPCPTITIINRDPSGDHRYHSTKDT